MRWNKEEEAVLEALAQSGAAPASIGAKAVELEQARGGMDFEDDVETVRVFVQKQDSPSDFVSVALNRIEAAHAAHGAQVAMLQAKVEEAQRVVSERDALHAMVAERDTLIAGAREREGIYEKALQQLRAEVEGLKAERDGLEWYQRAKAAESRLAAIRETAAKASAELRHAYRAFAVETGNVDPGLVARAIRMLEGVTTPKDGDSPQETKPKEKCLCDMTGGAELCMASRHPCSEMCTHGDAATPGHPQRVKARSEAVNVSLRMSIKDARSGDVVSEGELVRPDDDHGAARSDAYNDGWRDALAIVEERVRKAMENASAEVLSAIEGAAP